MRREEELINTHSHARTHTQRRKIKAEIKINHTRQMTLKNDFEVGISVPRQSIVEVIIVVFFFSFTKKKEKTSRLQVFRSFRTHGFIKPTGISTYLSTHLIIIIINIQHHHNFQMRIVVVAHFNRPAGLIGRHAHTHVWCARARCAENCTLFNYLLTNVCWIRISRPICLHLFFSLSGAPARLLRLCASARNTHRFEW